MLASLAVHALLAVLILPRSMASPPPKQEQTITVDLVREPPPPPKPQPKPQAPPPAQAKPQTPPPEPPKPDKPQAEKAPPQQQPPPPPMGPKPVMQFGDKDQGPRKTLEGRSPDDGSVAPPLHPDPPKQAQPQVLAVKTTGAAEVPLGNTAIPPTPGQDAHPSQAPKLKQAKTLFSRDITNDPSAMTRMALMQRDERFGVLCYSELQAQLQNGSPAYFPDQLPLIKQQGGNVLAPPNMAFHANSQWYDLNYRCEVDDLATKVVSFAFEVGKPLAPSQWASHGITP